MEVGVVGTVFTIATVFAALFPHGERAETDTFPETKLESYFTLINVSP